jgi:hypothetical protein
VNFFGRQLNLIHLYVPKASERVFHMENTEKYATKSNQIIGQRKR